MPPSPYADRLATIPVESRDVVALGARTRYWVYGPKDAATTIVVVHGFRGEHHGLEPVVAHLPEYRVVSPDLPGFGESEPLPGREHSIEGYGDWLAAFLDATGLADGTAVVLGHSFGSIVVSHAIARGIVRTPKLVLVNPIAKLALEGPKRAATAAAIAYYRLGAALPDRLGHALLKNPLIVRVMSETMAKTRDRELRAWIHGQHHSYFSLFADRRMLLEAFAASVSTDVIAAAPGIRIPTLLVAADRDDIVPLAAVEELADALPGARLRVLPGVGHLIHYELPGLAAQHIREFLAEDGR
ncbi:alpha/beta fold hydrolase [Desertivibrio insolitus]|uniref:alpha/beta fold hydrolase n=1 Tax=Herbiconiux sp. SYSU D00978 TaxID=2812562 RepID=UPI001A9761E8|nr:alpha/beta hydrolase [Herbiconiux sp. SYSU D00978]